jgi:hypothetical protein
MKKTISFILCIGLLAAILTGCFINNPPKSTESQINPNEEAANMEKVAVTLYFGYEDEYLLAGEPRVIEAPVSGRLETAVIKSMIEGPSPDNPYLKSLIDPSVKVVNVSEEGEYLFVTLNNEFIRSTATADETARRKKQLAVYSIANTLIELGGYSRVHLRVDKEGNGIGESITKAEAGFEGDAALEPMGFYIPVVLNPKNTVSEFFKNYANKDWEKVYAFIAYHDISGDERPSEDTFMSEVVSFNTGIEEYETQDYFVSADDTNATVMVDFSVKTKDAQNIPKKSMPVKLLKENNIWRVSYSSFEKVFRF